MIGLGVGTLAAYARPGDYFRFYEINPMVEQMARGYFHFLSDCSGKVDVIRGDARLALEREAPENFDVLVLDAFSGDVIPLHLLTVEAFTAYLRHVVPDGIIAVHISNIHFGLGPVVDAISHAHGLTYVAVMAPGTLRAGRMSLWVLVGATRTCSKPIASARRHCIRTVAACCGPTITPRFSTFGERIPLPRRFRCTRCRNSVPVL